LKANIKVLHSHFKCNKLCC